MEKKKTLHVAYTLLQAKYEREIEREEKKEFACSMSE